MKKFPQTKKPTYQDLATRLCLSRRTVEKYPKEKLKLMIKGLWFENEIRYLNELEIQNDCKKIK